MQYERKRRQLDTGAMVGEEGRMLANITLLLTVLKQARRYPTLSSEQAKGEGRAPGRSHQQTPKERNLQGKLIGGRAPH